MFKKITVLPTAICIALIRIYHYTLSPWVGYHCRFAPSCWHYALQSFQRFGFFRGCWLTLRRILRCHPWGGCGHDPIPPIVSISETIGGIGERSDKRAESSAAHAALERSQHASSWRAKGIPEKK